MRILPAIDVMDGQCVRLLRGDFDAATRYGADPAAMAAQFEQAGAEDLHLVDLDGAKAGAAQGAGPLGQIAGKTKLRIQTGGGVRALEDIALRLEQGALRVVLGSVVVKAPEIASEALAKFGGDRIVFALDGRMEGGVFRIATQGWAEASAVSLDEALERFAPEGLQHILVTDIDRDGALEGPNADLYAQIKRDWPALQLQASGGVSSLDDLRALRDAGADAAITGRALYEGRFTLEEALAC